MISIEGLELRFYAVIIAAIVTFALTQVGIFATRRFDAKREIQTLQKALRAELKSSVEQNGEAKDPELFRKISSMDIKTINAYTFPSMRREIFERNCDKVGRLPPETADAVVRAYGNIDLWNKFSEHIKSPEFVGADKSTQDVMISYFVSINDDVHSSVKKAIDAIESR